MKEPKTQYQFADSARREMLEQAAQLILMAIGEDPTREGLVGTPLRFARFWEEFVDYDHGNVDVTFESVCVDQLVIVRGIPVWSLCEHHLLPFKASISVGYIAGDHVLGLSKFARIAQKHAHGLQLQERLVQQVADDIVLLTGSQDVAVIAVGEHTCMQMRGVRSTGEMITSVMRGCFRDDPSSRAEFLSLAGV